jgi:hypothetical protein
MLGWYLLKAGEREEGEAVFAALRQERPWLGTQVQAPLRLRMNHRLARQEVTSMLLWPHA